MAKPLASNPKQLHSRLLPVLGFCLACIVLNIAGAQLALFLQLPVFLDSMGTILAAAVGGYVPGIVVGCLTNVINSVSDSSTIYYSIINVLIAVAAALFARHNWFDHLSKVLLSVLVFAFIGGGIGSLLTWLLYGSNIGEGISAPFAHLLYTSGISSMFVAQLCADLLIDLVDKALVTFLAVIVYHMMSENFRQRFFYVPWQQAPMPRSEYNITMTTDQRGSSLKTKIVAAVVVIMAIVAVATTSISYASFHRSLVDNSASTAFSITKLASEYIDADRVSEFIASGEQAEGYRETEAELARIRDSFDDVQYVYVYQIQEDGCHVVFDPDAADEPGSDPGDVVPFDNAFQKHVPDLLAGNEIDPIISNESYGWLLSAYTPLRNSTGSTACYVACDVSMERLVADEYAFLARTIALLSALFVLICSIALRLAKFSIIVPINSIARAAAGFVTGNENIHADSADKIDSLDIQTGDEIENLYKAVNQMSHDTVGYVEEARERNDIIARMQGNLIVVMADLVESRDKYTGDHIKNTSAYAQIIMNQMRLEGIYADQLTDEFISNVSKSAPLHDVGKIAVSDTILNKPARLTDEEFATMKGHTLAGKEILEGATQAVSESSYLDEAQNLAAYHHEKWDGSGYPYGISGEEIPLSARIMAVADVFDALVAKRSYKDGFPVDKALAIIEEGIGTHFDPNVARAFLHAQDKARAIAEASNGTTSAESNDKKDEGNTT